MFRRRFAAGLIFALGIALLAACDPTESFIIINSTDGPLVAGYRIVDRGGGSSVYAQNSYLIPPGEEINIADDESLSGDQGGEIFNTREAVEICGYSRGTLMYARIFSYEEAKSMGFRFEITERVGGAIELGICPPTNEDESSSRHHGLWNSPNRG